MKYLEKKKIIQFCLDYVVKTFVLWVVTEATDEEIREMLEKAYERGRRYAKEVPIMAIFDAFAKPDPRACKSMTSFIKTRGANYYLSDENREIEEFLVTRFCALKKGDKPKRSL